MNEMTKQPKGTSLPRDVKLRQHPLQYRFMPVLSESNAVNRDHYIILQCEMMKHSNLSTILMFCKTLYAL